MIDFPLGRIFSSFPMSLYPFSVVLLSSSSGSTIENISPAFFTLSIPVGLTVCLLLFD